MKKKKQEPPRREQPVFLYHTTSYFVLAVLVGQFLVFHDYYFDILETKYYYFAACTIIMLIAFLGYAFFTTPIKKTVENIKKINVRKVLHSTDIWVILFVLISMISTILSPYPYEAFWGNEGRYTGLFLILLYAAVYFCISRYYCLKRAHIEAFLAAGLLMCLHGITDFFGMDILHFKENMSDEQWFSFSSTIGNLNTYTACVALVMAVAGVLFATDTGIVGNFWHGLCVTVSFVALIMGVSDNAYLSLAAFFGFLPLYLFRSWKGIRKYLFLLALFLSSVPGIGYIVERFGIHYVKLETIYESLLLFLRTYPVVQLLWLVILCSYGMEYVVRCCRKYGSGKITVPRIPTPSPWFARVWWLPILAVTAVAVFALYDVNVAGNAGRYGKLQQYLLFSDS